MGIPAFIQALRTRIGHELLWLSGAHAVVFRFRSRLPQVLLGKRSDNGCWDHLAGIVEPGEHPADTLVREAQEELGIKITVGPLLDLRVTAPITYPNGDICQFLSHEFIAEWVSGEPRVCDDESCDVGWFYPGELPNPLGERVIGLLELGLVQLNQTT